MNYTWHWKSLPHVNVICTILDSAGRLSFWHFFSSCLLRFLSNNWLFAEYSCLVMSMTYCGQVSVLICIVILVLVHHFGKFIVYLTFVTDVFLVVAGDIHMLIILKVFLYIVCNIMIYVVCAKYSVVKCPT